MRQIELAAVLVLCMCAVSSAAVSVVGSAPPYSLVYSDPADLAAVIDPPGLAEVGPSLGVGLDKAAFQALNPQVVPLDGGPVWGSGAKALGSVVVNYSVTGTVTFTFPTPDKFSIQPGTLGYNYGGANSVGRSAFSGSNTSDDISTIPSTTDDGLLYNYFDARITTTGGKGVGAIGFCVACRNSITVPASPVTVTLSDGSTDTIDMPAVGLGTPYLYFFVGYQAPAGKTITRIEASRAPITGGGQAFQAIDDLAFVMAGGCDLVGDINGDCHVDVIDLLDFVAAFGTVPGDPLWVPVCDFNHDSSVDVIDLLMLVESFGT